MTDTATFLRTTRDGSRHLELRERDPVLRTDPQPRHHASLRDVEQALSE
jgi:hypothetical protein